MSGGTSVPGAPAGLDLGGTAPAALPAAARAARVVVALAFGAQGLAYGALITSLPGFKDRFGIGDDVVTLVVLGVCLMAAVGTVVSERQARGPGSRAVLVSGLAGIALAILVVALAPSLPVFLVGFALYGFGLGQVDAGTNMQAVALQRAYGRSILTGFYAAWSIAGILATVYVGQYVSRDVPQQVALPVVAVLVAVIGFLVLRRGWRAHDAPLGAPAESGDGRRSPLPWGAITVLGVAVAAYFVVDSAAATWSTIYLGDVLAAADDVAPLGYGAYLATTLVSRLAGDLAVRRWGRVAVVRTAGLVGALGLLAVVLAPNAAVAIGGLALTGLGLGVVVPLCFAAAGNLAPEHADAVVARLNGFNYLGAVLGGVFVGAIGVGSTLRIGYAVPLVLAVVVVLLAPRFASRRTAA
ncbi:MFS transporter [Cellulomonas cellasea]|uniref:Major facilitator transporter n=2 Tax=Cellulomonas cellasea TaxID=43670 RepID=A0A0A0B5B1_9CELL|nr:MFS transporter [Cellulomonas cellasea]KGM00979.1 major facilitator transporter [Cellulomonas cellasea DSM 20118]GEA88150.1 MFS transporter [Cellulomonas cellasea]